MKKVLKVVLCIFIALVFVMGGGVFYLSRGLDTTGKLIISKINPESLSDGVYDGKYKGGRWTNEMEITIKDHKISNIRVVKDVLINKPEVTQDIINKVIEKQNTNVDVISGSTVTSKAYLKAIEIALKK